MLIIINDIDLFEGTNHVNAIFKTGPRACGRPGARGHHVDDPCSNPLFLKLFHISRTTKSDIYFLGLPNKE